MIPTFTVATTSGAAGQTGERRGGNRFPIERELTIKILSSRKAMDGGAGRTTNISSTGVLFIAEKSLAPGRRLELSISWPVQLNRKCGLKLVARGRVVRVGGNSVAVEIDKYEFRTAGLPGSKRLVEITDGF